MSQSRQADQKWLCKIQNWINASSVAGHFWQGTCFTSHNIRHFHGRACSLCPPSLPLPPPLCPPFVAEA
eukprot:1140819-Pelagomonas_calceolata.AAC.2